MRTIRQELQDYSNLVGAGTQDRFVVHSLADCETQEAIERANAPAHRQIAMDFLGRADGILFHEPLPGAPEARGVICTPLPRSLRRMSRLV